MLDLEKEHWPAYNHIAGIDEVGRGPLCGPVLAAAVIFPRELRIRDIQDSKKLTAKKRSLLYDIIIKEALSIGVGVVHEDKIDEINILNATILAMQRAVKNLSLKPDMLLIDGNLKDISDIQQISVVKGDSKSQSIAAASIIAKVTRDHMMAQYDKLFPGYGFSRNMGYGTKEHISALSSLFSTPIHRKSFKPVSSFLPRFKDIDNMDSLSIQIAGSKLIRDGHELLCVNQDSDNELNILSLSDGVFHAFKLEKGSEDTDDIKKNINLKGRETLKDLFPKKDTTHSINISVISVQFTKDKPRITFKNL